MRCRICNHRLWELRARQCPECGTGFRPSEHEFAVGGAAFCCPHCDQHYYGTGERGELVPRSFQCIGCQQQVDMDEMVVRPADPSRPDEGMVRLPWDDRSEKGWVRTTISLIGLALVLPLRLGTMLCGRSADGGGGLRFLLIVAVVTALASVVPMVLFLPLMSGGIAGAGAGAPQPAQVLGVFSGMIGAAAVMIVLLPILAILVWAPTAHGILLMTGEVPGTFRRTVDALCFSGGAYIVSSIPCFGMYVGVPWWAVSSVMVLRNAQAVQTWCSQC